MKKNILVLAILGMLILGIGVDIQGQEERLEEELIFMEIPVVTAGKTEEKIGEIPASIVVITREDIETYGYTTLEEILENIPGLYMINDYWQNESYGVRGFWSKGWNDNIIIMVNGVNQISDYFNDYPLTTISVPVKAIDKIEVVRGPISVIYGSGAFFGAINIITNDFKKHPGTNTISCLGGSRKTRELFAGIGDSEGDFSYIFNGSVYNTHGINEPYTEMTSNPSNHLGSGKTLLEVYGLKNDSKTDGRLVDNRKYLGFSGTFKRFYVDTSHVETKRGISLFAPSINEGALANISSTKVSAGYKREFSDVVSVNGRFTYSQRSDYYEYHYYTDDFWANAVETANAYQIELDAFINPSSDLNITVGLSRREAYNVRDPYDYPFYGAYYSNVDPRLPDGETIPTNALYTEMNYNLLENLRLVLGGRLEQVQKYDMVFQRGYGTGDAGADVVITGTYKQDDIKVIPRAAAIYALNRNNVCKLLYGKAIKQPPFGQNVDMLSTSPNRPQLKSSEIQTIELNYITTFPRLTANISIFRNELNKIIRRTIEFDALGNLDVWSSNAGEMVTNGAEVGIQLALIRDLKMELSGTYHDTEDRTPGFEGIDMAYSPRFLGYGRASYRFNQGVTLALNGRYVDKMEAEWQRTQQNPAGARIGETVDAYFVLDSNLRVRDFLSKGLHLNVKCSNLLDKEIHYPTTTNNAWADKGTLGPGRAILATVEWKF